MNNWEVKKLGDVCSFFNGQPHEKVIDENGKYKLINSKFVSSEGENFKRTNNALSPLFVNDIVMVMSDVPNGKTLAKCFIVDKDDTYTLNQRICVIRSKNFDTRFLYYQLNRNKYLLSFDNGENQSNLRKDDILNCKLLVPPLLEQQRIVEILDEAFTAIAKAKANAEQNLKNAKELFESYLQGVFENGNENWETKCLDELGKITSSKRIYKSEYVKDGIPFYRTKEIKELSNGKNITLELFISRDKYNEIKKSFGVPQINDLLMSAVGTIGEIMVIENDDEFYFKDGNIVWFKEFKSLDTNYLKFALTAFVEKIKSLAIGAAYSALTIEKLNKYQISFPKAIEEQQVIVQKLNILSAETKKLEAIYHQKINDLEELKKSVLQKAFSGELKTAKALV